METMSGNEVGTRQLLSRFFTYYEPHRKLFALDFTCAVLSGVLELGFPMAVGLFIDRLLPGQDWGLILVASATLLAVYLLNTGLMVVVNYWGHMLGINIETEMRRKSFDHLQKLSFRFYDNQKTGHLVARVTKDLEEIGEVAHHGPEDLFVAVMTFVGAFVLMFIVNPKLALITAVIVPVTGLITARYGGRMTRTWRALFGRVGEFNARIEENVGGMRVVQAFANEDYERHLFAGDNARYRATKLEAYRIMAASMSLSYLSMRFTQLLDTEPDIVDAPDAIAVSGLRGDIRYENVTFGYGPDQTVLHDINLDIRAGETVAFVGPSGAGKTTICSLLPRFYEIDAGRITIDGIDIRRMTLASLRREIGIGQQEVFLFAGTIRENIAYGRLDATREWN